MANDIDREKIIEILRKYRDEYIKSDAPIKTLEDEYNMFVEFYSKVLEELNIDTNLSKDIAYDKVYNTDEYILYDDVKITLDRLKDKYTLLILSDNFPSIDNYLKEYKIYDNFDKIYISSIYEATKHNDKFFKAMINDYSIKEGEALFIDDNEDNLDMGIKHGLDVIMLDRQNKKESKYKRITNLDELEV
ncbi:MAG: HAD family hydrolase [Bacilli bacterium]|nr:HAD family hydrolase [Bacilli bacterium]